MYFTSIVRDVAQLDRLSTLQKPADEQITEHDIMCATWEEGTWCAAA